MGASPGSTITLVPGHGGSVFRIAGQIDETFEGTKLSGTSGVAIIDLDGVTRITSYGVREWVKALEGLAQASYIGFVKCRPTLVAQFNMVANFGGRGQVLTLYAPYICPACNKNIEVPVDLRKQYNDIKSFNLQPVTCPHCKAQAEFDDVPESYFSYVASQPQPTLPPAAEVLLEAGSGSNPSRAFHVNKQVDGSLTALWLMGSLDRSPGLKRLSDGLEGTVLICAEGVVSCTAEGVSHLGALLDMANVDLYVARIPEHMLIQMARRPGGWSRSRVLSIRLSLRCQQCQRLVPEDADVNRLRSILTNQAPAISCPQCNKPLQRQLSPELVTHLRGLKLSQPPQPVAEYLQRHPQPPERRAPEPPRGPLNDQELASSGSQFGRYNLIRLLGTGGMAEVYLARQTAVGGFEKNVVLKRILPQLSADDMFISMFLQEARLAARISHPNVVQIFDVGSVAGRYFIAMEYVRGSDLSVLLRLASRLGLKVPVEVSARIAADIGAGLEAAHNCTDENGNVLPIIHRDVSPHNVLVSSDGRVKLTDFGIAKAVDSGSRTPTETLKGKLSYMSPEQVRGDKNRGLDGRADIFAAGLILYQCLTLEHPFRRDTEFATFKAILNDPIPPTASKRPEVPRDLDLILAKALARDPDKRYATAAAYQRDLESLLARTGKSVGAGDVAAWSKELFRRAENTGLVLPEMALTPTARATPSQTDTAENTHTTAPIVKREQ